MKTKPTFSRFLQLLVVALAALALAACSSSEDDGGCADDEVQLSYLGTDNDRTECAPIPNACGATADCAPQACIAAMYDLCEAPAFGVACSDTFAPTIISCNE